MRLAILFENLDDKDEFSNCSTCGNAIRVMGLGAPQIDLDRFHRDHIESARVASKETDNTVHYGDPHMLYINNYHKQMYKRGWEWNAYESQWETIKESLDDKDTFVRTDCTLCNEQYRAETGKYAFDLADRADTTTTTDMEEFHAIHTTARQAALKAGQYGTPEYKSQYEDVMNRHQYYYIGGRYGSHWIKEPARPGWQHPVKESLDDDDEFEVEPEIDIDEYIVEYWGMNASSNVMLAGAKEYGWVPKSLGRWEQFEDIKTQFPDLYEAAVEVARESIG